MTTDNKNNKHEYHKKCGKMISYIFETPCLAQRPYCEKCHKFVLKSEVVVK